MQNLNWNDFLNEKLVVNCKTKYDAIIFLKECNKRNVIWGSGVSLLEYNNWNDHEENTCYKCYNEKLTFGSIGYYKKIEYNVYTINSELNKEDVCSISIDEYNHLVELAKKGIDVEINELQNQKIDLEEKIKALEEKKERL